MTFVGFSDVNTKTSKRFQYLIHLKLRSVRFECKMLLANLLYDVY